MGTEVTLPALGVLVCFTRVGRTVAHDGAAIPTRLAYALACHRSQKEWLECEYAEAVMPTALVVHANDAPGSLEKVSVFDEAGKEIEVWTGTDPTPRTAARGTSIIPIKPDFKVKKVKVYLDSPAVPGWNEIDAVGLRVKDKEEVLWAVNVTASSTYAAGFATATVTVPADQLESRSPLAMAVTLEMLRRGRHLSLEECFAMELHLDRQWFEYGDIIEGVRALIIDKDKQPRWNPPTLTGLVPKRVNQFFEGL